VTLSAPQAAAQRQSNSVNPTADAVTEQQLLEQFKTIQGRGSIPDTRSYTIEQPAGRDWRHFHEVTLRWIGAVAILGVLACSSSSICGAAWFASKAGARGARSCASTPPSASCTG